MINALKIRNVQNRVVLIQGRPIADLAAEEAEEIAATLRTIESIEEDGWLYDNDNVRIGKAEGHVALLYEGTSVLQFPVKVSKEIGTAIHHKSKIAQHWDILHKTKSRDRLYGDQQKIINSGLPYVNLGVPCEEMRTMGGMSVGRFGKVGLPSVVSTNSKRKALNNGR